jgi:hypothetical protein
LQAFIATLAKEQWNTTQPDATIVQALVLVSVGLTRIMDAVSPTNVANAKALELLRQHHAMTANSLQEYAAANTHKMFPLPFAQIATKSG